MWDLYSRGIPRARTACYAVFLRSVSSQLTHSVTHVLISPSTHFTFGFRRLHFVSSSWVWAILTGWECVDPSALFYFIRWHHNDILGEWVAFLDYHSRDQKGWGNFDVINTACWFTVAKNKSNGFNCILNYYIQYLFASVFAFRGSLEAHSGAYTCYLRTRTNLVYLM